MQFAMTSWIIIVGILCYKRLLPGGLQRNLIVLTPIAIVPKFYVLAQDFPFAVAALQACFLALVFIALTVLADKLEAKLGVDSFNDRNE